MVLHSRLNKIWSIGGVFIKKPNAHSSKPRRVLYVIRSVEGGVPVVAEELARGLDRNKYEPIILFDTHFQSEFRKKLSESDIKTIDLKKCLDDHVSSLSIPRKNLNISGQINAHFGKEYRRIYLSLKSFLKFLRWQAPMIRSFVKAIRKHRVELVHTHSSLHLAKPEIIAAWIANIPCISHNHIYYSYNHFDSMFTRLVDSFIYISKDVAKNYDSQGKSRFNGTVIHNGIDINRFTQPYDADLVRQEFNLQPDQPLVGIIGRIDWWKGHEYFLEAMTKVSKQIPNLKGLIIGALEQNVISNLNLNRQYYHKLKSLVNSLGLANKIIFTGGRSDVPRLIAALDVIVHASSIPEPFGLVIIEGMAAGKPVVATAAGGVLDIIEDGVNGLLVPRKDPEALAQALLQILSNPHWAKQMGMAAQRHVAKNFTVQNQVNAIEELYDDILAGPERGKKLRH